MTISLDRELSVAVELARTCGVLALEHQRGGNLDTRDKPDGQGPVTRADIELNARIVSALRQQFPGDDVIAEESAAVVVAGRDRCWYIDPVDGTTEFARGEPDWAIHIGLCIAGVPVLGIVHEPAAERLAWGLCHGDDPRAELETCGDRRRLDITAVPRTALRLVSSKSHASPRILAAMQRLDITPDRNLRCGSTGVKVLTVARGAAELYIHPTPGTKAWDTCAPQAVLAGAGGRLSDVRGQPLVYDPKNLHNNFGLLAVPAALHAELVAELAAVVAPWFTA